MEIEELKNIVIELNARVKSLEANSAKERVNVFDGESFGDRLIMTLHGVVAIEAVKAILQAMADEIGEHLYIETNEFGLLGVLEKKQGGTQL